MPPNETAGPAAPSPAPTGAVDPAVDAGVRYLLELLVPGETLEAHAIQRRVFALDHRRLIVAATTGRFIALTRHILGGFTSADVRWQDLHDANLREGTFGADLTITAAAAGDLASADTPGRSVTYQGLQKEAARRVYRVCQEQEQAWREKRRVRDLDEMRAKSGGIQLGSTAAGTASQSADSSPETPAARLLRAKEMLDSGLITDAEYESIKARIVDGL